MADRIVYLDVGRFVHPLYREQVHAAPPGWRYELSHPGLHDDTVATKRIVEQRARLAGLRRYAERVALRALSEGGYVHRVKATAPPAARLIHSAERLLRGSPRPYVVDFEHASAFVLYQRVAFERPWAQAALRRALLDERLRFVLPWSDAARRSLLAAVPAGLAEAIRPKLRVVSPAIRPVAAHPRRRGGGPLRLLFIGTAFLEKGGVEAVSAVREARRTHDVTLDVVAYSAPEWRARLRSEAGVTLHEGAGPDVVRRLYEEADALLFPSHMDTFGYVVLEAMAHALPVLAPAHLALAEIVSDGESGLQFAPENMLYAEDTRLRFRHTLPPPRSYLRALERPTEAYVRGIATAIARLAEDGDLYSRLSEGALESVRSGPLSTGRRRALLAEIYELAVA